MEKEQTHKVLFLTWLVLVLSIVMISLGGPAIFAKTLGREMSFSVVALVITAFVAAILLFIVKNPRLQIAIVVVGGLLLLGGTLIAKSGFPPSTKAVAIMGRELVTSIAIAIAFWATWSWLEGKNRGKPEHDGLIAFIITTAATMLLVFFALLTWETWPCSAFAWYLFLATTILVGGDLSLLIAERTLCVYRKTFTIPSLWRNLFELLLSILPPSAIAVIIGATAGFGLSSYQPIWTARVIMISSALAIFWISIDLASRLHTKADAPHG